MKNIGVIIVDENGSTGMGGISADDPDAVKKLTAKLEKLTKAQESMKAVNAYYRKHKSLEGCPELDSEATSRRPSLPRVLQMPTSPLALPTHWGSPTPPARLRTPQRLPVLWSNPPSSGQRLR